MGCLDPLRTTSQIYNAITIYQSDQPVGLETVRHRWTIETRLIDERRRIQSTAVVVERRDALRLAGQRQPGEGASGVAARRSRVLLEGGRPRPHRVTKHGIHLLKKGMFYITHVSSQLDHSKHFTLHLLADLFIPAPTRRLLESILATQQLHHCLLPGTRL